MAKENDFSKLNIGGVDLPITDDDAQQRLATLEAEIPAAASPQNQLADKAFVTENIGDTNERVSRLEQRGGKGSLPSVFTLEQSSSSLFTVSDNGAAREYVENMGGYLFYVKSGQVYAAKLNPYNWGKFADGATITANVRNKTETMIHVPDCYFKASGQTMRLGGMTPVEGGHKFGSPNWVGAYQMSAGGHSRPGAGSEHSKTMTAFHNLAKAIHQDFGLANYGFHCLINAVYQAMYGNLNSESLLSNDNVRSSASWDAFRDLIHGKADVIGDGSGCVSAVDRANVTRFVTKLFGFEDLFGKLWEFRPGIRFYMDGDVRHAVVYDGNVVSNTAEGRDISGVLASASGQYVSAMQLGEYWDMFGKTISGSDTTFYCDGYWASTGGELLVVGGVAGDGSLCGLSYASSDNAFGYSNDYIGARLAFYAEPEIVSGSELLAMLA